jgi:hypothetical protein
MLAYGRRPVKRCITIDPRKSAYAIEVKQMRQARPQFVAVKHRRARRFPLALRWRGFAGGFPLSGCRADSSGIGLPSDFGLG